ncbi:hypothetical protein [Gilvibacter sp.]|uniref:hypothetical protein n=1 Tax=Gilvibacter sp. TaxID=2729997 RepID=UPI003F4A253C
MKLKITLIALFGFMLNATGQEAAIIDLDPNQSMSITGKGPGQDATINPYVYEDSIIVVSNIGKGAFSIRVQKEGEILQEFAVKPEQTQELIISKGLEIYFDTEVIAKAAVSYKPVKKE